MRKRLNPGILSYTCEHQVREALMTVADQALCPGSGARPHPNGRKQGPAYNQTCYTCQKVGHLAKVCMRRLNQCVQPGGRSARSKGVHSLMHISNIKDNNIGTDPAPLLTVSIISPTGSIKTKALPDSGQTFQQPERKSYPSQGST